MGTRGTEEELTFWDLETGRSQLQTQEQLVASRPFMAPAPKQESRAG
jgi:hypothetical protein